MATIDNDTRSPTRSDSPRARVQGALDSARDRAASAGQQVGTRVDEAPLIAIAGGVALGAAIGALLPRTEREARTLGAAGNRIGLAASEAVRAAVDAGKQELGLSQPAKSPVEAIIDKALGAVSAAGTAAGSAAASKVTGNQPGDAHETHSENAPLEGQ